MSTIFLPEDLYTVETLPDGRVIHCCTMRQNVLHCIGMLDSQGRRHRPYRRHGRTFYRPWRNYFTTNGRDDGWDALCDAGYARRGHVSDRGVSYHITRAGLDWIGAQLGIVIHDESN